MRKCIVQLCIKTLKVESPTSQRIAVTFSKTKTHAYS